MSYWILYFDYHVFISVRLYVTSNKRRYGLKALTGEMNLEYFAVANRNTLDGCAEYCAQNDTCAGFYYAPATANCTLFSYGTVFAACLKDNVGYFSHLIYFLVVDITLARGK